MVLPRKYSVSTLEVPLKYAKSTVKVPHAKSTVKVPHKYRKSSVKYCRSTGTGSVLRSIINRHCVSNIKPGVAKSSKGNRSLASAHRRPRIIIHNSITCTCI